jgi:hypothetical protein
MKNKKYLLQPLIFLILVFFVDKIFLLDYFQNKMVVNGNSVFYKHRSDQIKTFAEFQTDLKKVMVLGDSRSYPISVEALTDSQRGKLTVFNFSSPQAIPAYYLYLWEELKKQNSKVDAVIISISPESFQKEPKLFHTPFLRFGASNEFIQKYKENIPTSALFSLAKDKFLVYPALEWDSKILFTKLFKEGLSGFNKEDNLDIQLLNQSQGAYFRFAVVDNDEEKLIRDTERISQLYLRHFEFGEEEFYFLEELLKDLNKENIKALVVWPKVYPDYYKKYETLKIPDLWWPRILMISERHNAKTLNLNQASNCNIFNDASHQNIFCFQDSVPKMMDLIFGN